MSLEMFSTIAFLELVISIFVMGMALGIYLSNKKIDARIKKHYEESIFDDMYS